jgi:putative membrane protein
VRSRFTAAEHQRIDAAIGTIEQRSTADLDLMVTRASDRYSLYPLVWAGFGAVVVTGLAALVRPDLNGRTMILLQLMVLIVLTPLFDWLPIRLWLVPTRVKHAHARQLAHREFDAHFTGGKSNRKRILFFVSLGEHYVEIIADHDTHARVPRDVWNEVVGDFMAAVKVGHVVDGLIAAIESCGALLKTHYPGIDDDPLRPLKLE